VIELRPAENRVIVGDADDLLTRTVPLRDLFWSVVEPGGQLRVRAKIRYNMEPQPAVLYPGEAKLLFDDPARAVTPGQIAVAYRGKTVVAGGTIA